MEKFSLDKWLQDKSRKIVTRDGREVDIVKYDMKGTHFPVLYVISNKDGSQEPCECSKRGMCLFDNTQSSTDLFFADEEEELTEFEKELQTIISEASHWTSEDGSISTYCQFGDKEIKKISAQVLDLARKELRKEQQEKLGTLEMPIDVTEPYYIKGKEDAGEAKVKELVAEFEKGRQDALKDFPKWKKMPNGIQGNGDFNPTYLVRTSNGYYFTTPCLSWDKDNMYIELSELEKLPKEE